MLSQSRSYRISCELRLPESRRRLAGGGGYPAGAAGLSGGGDSESIRDDGPCLSQFVPPFVLPSPSSLSLSSLPLSLYLTVRHSLLPSSSVVSPTLAAMASHFIFSSLESKLSKFAELDEKQFEFQLVGVAELRNVKLRPDALRELGFPFDCSGTIDRITVRLPWSWRALFDIANNNDPDKIKMDTVVIEVSGVRVRAALRSGSAGALSAVDAAAAAATHLREIERAWRLRLHKRALAWGLVRKEKRTLPAVLSSLMLRLARIELTDISVTLIVTGTAPGAPDRAGVGVSLKSMVIEPSEYSEQRGGASSATGSVAHGGAASTVAAAAVAGTPASLSAYAVPANRGLEESGGADAEAIARAGAFKTQVKNVTIEGFAINVVSRGGGGVEESGGGGGGRGCPTRHAAAPAH